jgi:energy-coupling factor transporter ATP-binding protein EcfA2
MLDKDPELSVSGLGKRFGELVALHGVALCVGPGEIVGLVGRNGAGKTTTMRAVMGILAPDRGTVMWDGEPVGDRAVQPWRLREVGPCATVGTKPVPPAPGRRDGRLTVIGADRRTTYRSQRRRAPVLRWPPSHHPRPGKRSAAVLGLPGFTGAIAVRQLRASQRPGCAVSCGPERTAMPRAASD